MQEGETVQPDEGGGGNMGIDPPCTATPLSATSTGARMSPRRVLLGRPGAELGTCTPSDGPR
jgi:hypothetical protein